MTSRPGTCQTPPVYPTAVVFIVCYVVHYDVVRQGVAAVLFTYAHCSDHFLFSFFLSLDRSVIGIVIVEHRLYYNIFLRMSCSRMKVSSNSFLIFASIPNFSDCYWNCFFFMFSSSWKI